MLWLKKDRWKAGFALAGMLFLLVLMVWFPVLAAGPYEGTSGLATPVTGTVQATPTVDATVTALNKEKLQHENDWWWSYGATILSGFISALVLVIGGLFGFWRWRVERRDAQAKELADRIAAQDKELADRIAAQDKELADRVAAQDKELADRITEREKRGEILVQRYLFQLQDALEALDDRIGRGRRGRHYMTEEYFKESTLYALGRVLAIERIFALEAVYPQLERIYPGLGEFLKEWRIDHLLQHPDFWQYDRISLAEAVMEHEGDLFRPSTYFEFRRRYEAEHSPEKQWLAPASEAILSLPTDGKLQKAITKIAERIAHETGIAWSK